MVPIRDEKRLTMAGQRLPLPGCLLLIKQDMAEVVHTFGFVSWQSLRFGCPCCGASKDELYDVRDIDKFTWPWPRHDAAVYEQACSACVNPPQPVAALPTNTRMSLFLLFSLCRLQPPHQRPPFPPTILRTHPPLSLNPIPLKLAIRTGRRRNDRSSRSKGRSSLLISSPTSARQCLLSSPI